MSVAGCGNTLWTNTGIRVFFKKPDHKKEFQCSYNLLLNLLMVSSCTYLHATQISRKQQEIIEINSVDMLNITLWRIYYALWKFKKLKYSEKRNIIKLIKLHKESWFSVLLILETPRELLTLRKVMKTTHLHSNFISWSQLFQTLPLSNFFADPPNVSRTPVTLN